MSWIRQAAEYLVRALRGSSSGGMTPDDVRKKGAELHAKLLANYGVQYAGKGTASVAGEYPRRRTGALQASLSTMVYKPKDGKNYLVSQTVDLDLLQSMAGTKKISDPRLYPGILYDQGRLTPADSLREDGLNVIEDSPFMSVQRNGVDVLFTKTGT